MRAPPVDRVDLARHAYRRALADARAASTPLTWRRLVRAGRNLRLAVAQARAEAEQLRAPPPALPRRARTVLVVEDDEATRDALREILAGQGLEVWAAADAAAALDLLRRTAAPPSVIVLDLVLPGMSGWELRSRLLGDARFARVPVVVLSAVRDLRVPRARHHFEKPFDPADVVDAVRRLADGR